MSFLSKTHYNGLKTELAKIPKKLLTRKFLICGNNKVGKTTTI